MLAMPAPCLQVDQVLQAGQVAADGTPVPQAQEQMEEGMQVGGAVVLPPQWAQLDAAAPAAPAS